MLIHEFLHCSLKEKVRGCCGLNYTQHLCICAQDQALHRSITDREVPPRPHPHLKSCRHLMAASRGEIDIS